MRRPSPGGGQGAALRPRCRDETWCRDDTCTGRPRLPCAARREPRAGRWSAPRRARRPDRADGTQMELHTRWGDVVGARLLVKWGSPELRRTSEASCEARKLKRADLGGDREQILLFLKKEVLHLYLFNLASEGICSKTVWSFPANQKRGCAHACVRTPACVHTPTCGQGPGLFTPARVSVGSGLRLRNGEKAQVQSVRQVKKIPVLHPSRHQKELELKTASTFHLMTLNGVPLCTREVQVWA